MWLMYLEKQIFDSLFLRIMCVTSAVCVFDVSAYLQWLMIEASYKQSFSFLHCFDQLIPITVELYPTLREVMSYPCLYKLASISTTIFTAFTTFYHLTTAHTFQFCLT